MAAFDTHVRLVEIRVLHAQLEKMYAAIIALRRDDPRDEKCRSVLAQGPLAEIKILRAKIDNLLGLETELVMTDKE